MVAAGCCSASRRICDTPSSAACAAAESPEGPEPMMAILNMEEWRLAGDRLLYPGIGAASKPRSPGGQVDTAGSRCGSMRPAPRTPWSPAAPPLSGRRTILKCETAHRRQDDPCMLAQQKLEPEGGPSARYPLQDDQPIAGGAARR